MAESKEQTETIRPKRYKLNKEQRALANAYLDGESKIDAFMRIYNHPEYSKQTALNSANNVLRNKNVAEYINDKRKLAEERLVAKELWDRERSVMELTSLIDKNKSESERQADAIEDEIDFLLHEMADKPDDDELQKRNMKLIFTKRQKLRSTRTVNDVILGAVSELNKMHGFNEQNINTGGTIIFKSSEFEE